MTAIRLAIMSDLHLEFAPYEPELGPEIDLVLLAGDIHCPGVRAVTWASALGVPSALIMGNHEYYGSDLREEQRRMRETARDSSCVLLENEAYLFRKEGREVRILGSTLWTDFRLLGDAPRDVILAKEKGLEQLSDFRMIRSGRALLSPDDTIEMHEVSLDFLRRALADPFAGETVVMTHHSPTPFSSPQQYIGTGAIFLRCHVAHDITANDLFTF